MNTSRFGFLTVTKIVAEGMVEADCDCGEKGIVVPLDGLEDGSITSCGCGRSGSISRLDDLTAQRFGKLTPQKYLGNRKWLCRCDCGREETAYSCKLKRGETKMCAECQKKN